VGKLRGKGKFDAATKSRYPRKGASPIAVLKVKHCLGFLATLKNITSYIIPSIAEVNLDKFTNLDFGNGSDGTDTDCRPLPENPCTAGLALS